MKAAWPCSTSRVHAGRCFRRRIEPWLLARGAWPTELKWSETTSRDRSLVSYGLSHLEALEFRMLQIERSSRIITCTRMRSAELLRFGPRLKGGFALPHRV